jgi:SAM-dependent methyltransferase
MKRLFATFANLDENTRACEVGAGLIQDAYPPEERYPPEAKVGGHRNDIEDVGGIYHGLDLQAGTNIDIVATDPLHWPVEDSFYDLIFSAQCLEHVDDLQAFMTECYRCLIPGGVTIHVVPSTGPYHAYPIHCWNIQKDGMQWLLNVTGFETLECDQQVLEPWNDCWGVGRKPT